MLFFSSIFSRTTEKTVKFPEMNDIEIFVIRNQLIMIPENLWDFLNQHYRILGFVHNIQMYIYYFKFIGNGNLLVIDTNLNQIYPFQYYCERNKCKVKSL